MVDAWLVRGVPPARRGETRTVRFGKRHAVTVTFTRIDGWWHAHGALLPRPSKRFREARTAVRDRLARLGKKEVSDG